MFSCVLSGGVRGIESFIIRVEADLSEGMPVFELVGYLGSEVKEARERVKTALKNSGKHLPAKHLTVNLAPADIRKSGTGYDMPMAVAILQVLGEIPCESTENTLFAGELMLSGEFAAIEGVLPVVLKGKSEGLTRFIVPVGNAEEAALADGVEVYGVKDLTELMAFLNGELELMRVSEGREPEEAEEEADLKYVNGQKLVRRGVEIAAAGLHNLLMVGPPGSGKSMIAKCIPTILPPLSREESLEVTSIYSVAGTLNGGGRLITKRPFVSPHHTVTEIGMTGGGIGMRPGCISLAHRGVLFLDEMPEFSRSALETLRQPLEDGRVTITRYRGSYTYPADMMLVGAMNPCPCGAYPDLSKCSCSKTAIRRYTDRLSKPLLDRIDICIRVEKLEYKEMFGNSENESSADVKERVIRAHRIQKERFQGQEGVYYNSQMGARDIRRFCALKPKDESFMAKMAEGLNISARSYHKILKVARTIADLAGSDGISRECLVEAIHYNRMYEV